MLIFAFFIFIYRYAANFFPLFRYLENVIPRENGVTYSPIFPITWLVRKLRPRGGDRAAVPEEHKPILQAEEGVMDDVEVPSHFFSPKNLF
jgi:hypothetical protein